MMNRTVPPQPLQVYPHEFLRRNIVNGLLKVTRGAGKNLHNVVALIAHCAVRKRKATIQYGPSVRVVAEKSVHSAEVAAISSPKHTTANKFESHSADCCTSRTRLNHARTQPRGYKLVLERHS